MRAQSTTAKTTNHTTTMAHDSGPDQSSIGSPLHGSSLGAHAAANGIAQLLGQGTQVRWPAEATSSSRNGSLLSMTRPGSRPLR